MSETAMARSSGLAVEEESEGGYRSSAATGKAVNELNLEMDLVHTSGPAVSYVLCCCNPWEVGERDLPLFLEFDGERRGPRRECSPDVDRRGIDNDRCKGGLDS